MSLKRLNVEKNKGNLFFQNPPFPQKAHFPKGKKGVLIMSGHSISFKILYLIV